MRTDTREAALTAAIEYAQHAPSVFNTQPWQWHLAGTTAELHLDPDRQLRTVDPAARLQTISCGVVLHHARIALAVAGHGVLVERWPADGPTTLAARLRLLLDHEPAGDERAMYAAVPRRRTDRRPYGDVPVPSAVVDRLVTAAIRENAGLHVLRRDQLPAFSVAVARAGDLEIVDPAYRGELIRWTNRPPWSGDGVPPTTAVPAAGRIVPPREFSLGVERGLHPGPGTDRGAAFAVLTANRDDERGWLHGGEALSAVLLTATANGLSTAPISDVIEVGATREALRRILGTDRYPYLALRTGYGPSTADIPVTPRRPAAEVVRDGGTP